MRTTKVKGFEPLSGETLESGNPFISPVDLALDLDATTRSVDGRLYWEEDSLVRLGQIAVDLSALLELFPTESKNKFKASLIAYASSRQVGLSTIIGTAQALQASAANHSPYKFDLYWTAKSLESDRFRRNKNQIRLVLEHLRDRAPELVMEEALIFLARAESCKLTSRNVESDNPEKSWLTNEEYDDVLRHTWDCYDQSGCNLSALARLLALQYARRPSQLASLKFIDLKSGESKSIKELSENEIHFPAAKERDAGSDFRDGKFEAHPIADHLWNILTILRQEIRIKFEQVLGVNLSETEVNSLPIFTNTRRIKKAAALLRDKLNLNPSEHIGDELFHLTATQLGRVVSFEQNLEVCARDYLTGKNSVLPISKRTNKPITLNIQRLRHTRARQLARQGVPKVILSYWLGHNDDTAVDAYYDDPAEDARRFDEIMGKGLAPIAQAFHGKIITTDAEATHPNDPSKRLEFAADERLEYVGRCGKFSFCATTSIPIPCYRCKNFEPIADAPHEEVLNALRYRQTQEHALIKPGSLRNLLIPIDLSEDIRAVERCIELCKIKRGEK